MLRLTDIAETDQSSTVKVEGAIAGESGSLLEAECVKRLERRRELVLDFSGVTRIDRRSATMLHTLTRVRDVKVIKCPPLIAAEIRSGSEGADERGA